MVLTFLGTKGGTGTTTLAINCAADLHRLSLRPTVIVDLKAGTGDVGLFLNLRSRCSLSDLVDRIEWTDPVTIPDLLPRHACGVHVVVAAEEFGAPSLAEAAGLERVLEALQAHFEHVVIDAGSGVSPWSAVALRMSDEVMLVANPDVPCLRNLQRLGDLVRLAGVPDDRIRHLLNRTSDLDLLPMRQIEDVLGRRIDYRFTSEYRTVASAMNAGGPLSPLRGGALRAELDMLARSLLSRLSALAAA